MTESRQANDKGDQRTEDARNVQQLLTCRRQFLEKAQDVHRRVLPFLTVVLARPPFAFADAKERVEQALKAFLGHHDLQNYRASGGGVVAFLMEQVLRKAGGTYPRVPMDEESVLGPDAHTRVTQLRDSRKAYDQAAAFLGSLYEPLSRALRSWGHLREDAIQQEFQRLLMRNLEDYDSSRGTLLRLFRTTTRHRAIELQRKEHGAPSRKKQATSEVPQDSVSLEQRDPAPTPRRPLSLEAQPDYQNCTSAPVHDDLIPGLMENQRAIDHPRVREFLAQLQGEDRLVFRLRVLGSTPKEIAQTLVITEKASSVRCSRVTTKFREFLQGE